jgi:hypothetical protein
MLKRCYNLNHRAFHNYGGRNPPTTVCKPWHSFEGFFAFVARTYPDGNVPSHLTLNRIDNDKGYSPDNCNWATYAEQNRNRRPPKRKRRAKLADIHAYVAALVRATRGGAV